MEHGLYIGSITHYVGFTPPYGVTNVTGQCGRDNVTNMSSPSSATPQGSQSNSLGFAAKVLYAWTMLAARPMKCRRTIDYRPTIVESKNSISIRERKRLTETTGKSLVCLEIVFRC